MRTNLAAFFLVWHLNENKSCKTSERLQKKLLFFRPPFRAYNQKELAEKIREGKFRRIPYRYSEQLNELLKEMLNLKVRTNYYFSTHDTN